MKFYNEFLKALDPFHSDQICFSKICWQFQNRPDEPILGVDSSL